MRSFGNVLTNPVARAGDRLGSGGEIGSIEHFAFNPGDGWLPADGSLVSWSAQLAKALHPSFDTFEAPPAFVTFTNVRDMVYGGGVFLVADNTGVKWTANGDSWSAATISTAIVGAVAYGNGYWAALDADGAVWRSSNLTTWTKVSTFATTPRPSALNFIAGLWVGNVLGTASNAYVTSPDLINWTARTMPVSVNWQRANTDGDILAIVAAGTIAATRDGINWNYKQNGTGAVARPWVSDGLIFAGSGNAQLAVSDDVCATVSYISTPGIAYSTFAKSGDELAAIAEGAATRSLRLIEPWRNATVFGNNTNRLISIGAGRIIVFDGTTTCRRSMLLRTPLRPRRPGAPLAEKPYVKVA